MRIIVNNRSDPFPCQRLADNYDVIVRPGDPFGRYVGKFPYSVENRFPLCSCDPYLTLRALLAAACAAAAVRICDLNRYAESVRAVALIDSDSRNQTEIVDFAYVPAAV